MEARDGRVGEDHVVGRLLSDGRARLGEIAHHMSRRIEQPQPANGLGRRGTVPEGRKPDPLFRHGADDITMHQEQRLRGGKPLGAALGRARRMQLVGA